MHTIGLRTPNTAAVTRITGSRALFSSRTVAFNGPAAYVLDCYVAPEDALDGLAVHKGVPLVIDE